jgi:crotonobetainyl-CoA:carnitine CoA-transferase CaiB-like acyl-CoA transferase
VVLFAPLGTAAHHTHTHIPLTPSRTTRARLATQYTGKAPINTGLAHPSIAPYGAFSCSDGKSVLISIQNEREWQRLCSDALDWPELATDPRFCGPGLRVANRDELDAAVASVCGAHTRDEMMELFQKARIACAAVNELDDLLSHPQLRTAECALPNGGGMATVVAPPVWQAGAPTDGAVLGDVPAFGQHTDAVLAEFLRSDSA